jgi:TetR/AcrR family transcriptional regulator
MATTAPQRSSDGNRISLIKAAADAFAETGYEGASLRSIAETAGVSYQLISHYFGNKEDLWRATLEYLFERYLETGNGLGFDLSGNVRLQFRNHIRLLLTDLLQRPQIRKIWTQEYFAASARYTDTIEAQIQTLVNELATPYYREVVRLKIVKQFSPEEISILMGAILQLNIVYPYPLELALGADIGTAKSVNRQVDLMFDLLTTGDDERDSASSGAVPETKGAGQPAAPTAAGAGAEAAEPGADPHGNEAELVRLRAENTDLKRVLADLLVQKAALHGKLRAAN